jgi:hypothetical protein
VVTAWDRAERGGEWAPVPHVHMHNFVFTAANRVSTPRAQQPVVVRLGRMGVVQRSSCGRIARGSRHQAFPSLRPDVHGFVLQRSNILLTCRKRSRDPASTQAGVPCG